MGREISFRAWHKKNRQYHTESGVMFDCIKGIQSETSAFIFEQFTGLIDCNGTKLFEGDVFKRLDTGCTFVVLWERDCFVARKKYDSWLKKDVFNEKHDTSIFFWKTFKIKLVGNIHEENKKK
jgi:hypothetical protein